MSQSITTNFTAGQVQKFYEQGDFFRLMQDGSGSFNVNFYLQGVKVTESIGIRAGYSERFLNGMGFDAYEVYAVSAATGVQFVSRLGNVVTYDTPPTGSVTIANGGFSQAQATVTTASSTISAVNLGRRYLLIQNKDTTGTIYVRIDGAAATAANGLTIEPGGSFEISGRCPNGAITAIGDIASNANIIVIEG